MILLTRRKKAVEQEWLVALLIGIGIVMKKRSKNKAHHNQFRK